MSWIRSTSLNQSRATHLMWCACECECVYNTPLSFLYKHFAIETFLYKHFPNNSSVIHSQTTSIEFMQYILFTSGSAMMLINSHIEQPALGVNTRLSTTDKQGATAAGIITGRMPLVDTNVIMANTIVLREGGGDVCGNSNLQ